MHPITDALPATLCYLNGEFTALRDAKISVLDRGFIFGDGIYEYVPVYFGQPFCFEEHMARLDRSLAELQIDNPHTLAQWRDIVMHLVAPGGEAPQSVYFQVTRGVAPRDHAMVRGLVPTVFVMVNPLPPISDAVRAKGVACVTADDFRWQKAHIKSTSLLGAVLARQISVEAGATETIMFRGEWLSEASSSNVWVVKNGKLMGPPKDNLVLTGIRYGLFERLCEEQGIAYELRRITRDEVFAADELLISSASKELLPVVTLDGQAIGNGRPGPIYDSLYKAYQQAKVRNAQKHGAPA
ncbi:D-alanine transaminase [Variovorax sp. OK605]|jgi:D-alanine transaminase|uniref:D-amino acid aminotransferase n=1 Tax=unclassified Variovorax TaxID=663243 RepID=UPI0008D052D7|nr:MULTISPECIES: D-amino acid aminotransferase [unclassified Variovorax]SEK14457.1 D-alanine transaminase [Variovorax sp. OK202]SFD97911.1 D-alanine transaminase [Variovorax sp. OK212]SFQ48002.1 D-alanine transaminase [Variovorax sp. OK605]